MIYVYLPWQLDNVMILEKAVQCLWYMTNPMAYCAPDRDHQKSCPAAAIIVVRVCQSVTPLV